MLAAFFASVPLITVYCQELGITGTKTGIVLTALSVTAILFRPIAGYLLDNFNRYKVYFVFLLLFCLSFPAFLIFPFFAALVMIRLYMGAVYSVCGSATMTLASDLLPRNMITPGINRFAFTVSIGMALGPFIGIQVQNNMHSQASFICVFILSLCALAALLFCRIEYPEIERKRFSVRNAFYKPAYPFMINMTFFMIPYGAVIAYSSILAYEKEWMNILPYFYIVLVAGMLVAKFFTQKMVDAGKHRTLVTVTLVLLTATMISYIFMHSKLHMMIAAFIFGTGYGIMQPLFQSFVTGTTPPPMRGVANATYLLSYDIGIGIGAFAIGVLHELCGLLNGFAWTAVTYLAGGFMYICYVENYYQNLKKQQPPINC